MKRAVVLTLSLLAITAASAADLVQLMPPADLTVTLYPGQTRALVREVRQVHLEQGDNLLSFSWGAAAIDVSSVALAMPDGDVGEATRPTGQDQTLLWRVMSAHARQVEVTFSYFLDGCKWSTAYELALEADGKTATLSGWLKLENATGMPLRQARLQIATVGPSIIDSVNGDALPVGETAVEAPLLPGLADIAAGDTVVRQFLSLAGLPAAFHYRYQADKLGGAVKKVLTLSLPEKGLGGLPALPAGALILYGIEDDGIPLLRTTLTFQPGRTLDVDLGAEADVVVERKLMNVTRSNFETDRYGRLIGSDTAEEYLLTVHNHLSSDVKLEVAETVLSTWELQPTVKPVLTDLNAAHFELPVKADDSAELRLSFVKHSGSRARK